MSTKEEFLSGIVNAVIQTIEDVEDTSTNRLMGTVGFAYAVPEHIHADAEWIREKLNNEEGFKSETSSGKQVPISIIVYPFGFPA